VRAGRETAGHNSRAPLSLSALSQALASARFLQRPRGGTHAPRARASVSLFLSLTTVACLPT